MQPVTALSEEEVAAGLARMIAALVAIARDHGKCLACHCYRDVAEQALGAVTETIGADPSRTRTAVGAGSAAGEDPGALRDLLATTAAGHG